VNPVDNSKLRQDAHDKLSDTLECTYSQYP